jgi:hypothetical protein
MNTANMRCSHAYSAVSLELMRQDMARDAYSLGILFQRGGIAVYQEEVVQ